MLSNMSEKNITLDSVFKSFEGSLNNLNKFSEPRQAITIWVPSEYKTKYDMIQSASKRQFGKLVRELLKKSIDKIDLESLES